MWDLDTEVLTSPRSALLLLRPAGRPAMVRLNWGAGPLSSVTS